MMTIEWGDVDASPEERREIEQRLELAGGGRGHVLALRRRDGGYEAAVRRVSSTGPTSLRFHGDDLLDVVRRAADLLEVVAAESARAREQSAP
jgi:hypothetical protein